MEQIGVEAKLPERLKGANLHRDAEIREAFDQLLDDPDPGYLDAGALRLTTLLTQELRDLQSTESEGTIYAIKGIEGAVARITALRTSHVRR